MNRSSSTYCPISLNANFSSTFVGMHFTGKVKDSESGSQYFGARYYDSEALTGWLSVDPMADKYPSISPYAYCAWTRPTGGDEHRWIKYNIVNNPVKLVDPDGREIDVSAIYDKNGKARKGCEAFCSVLEYFASTKIGYNYLQKFAKAGQTIAGQNFDKDGRFHNKNIDLKITYNEGFYNIDNRSGYTEQPTSLNNNGRYQLTIHIAHITNSGKFGLLETFCHEFFIHAMQGASHYYRNGNFIKSSNNDQELNDINNNHYMRDLALTIMTGYEGKSRKDCVDEINRTKLWKSHYYWSK